MRALAIEVLATMVEELARTQYSRISHDHNMTRCKQKWLRSRIHLIPLAS